MEKDKRVVKKSILKRVHIAALEVKWWGETYTLKGEIVMVLFGERTHPSYCVLECCAKLEGKRSKIATFAIIMRTV